MICSATAQIIRDALKEAFPETNFLVQSRDYADSMLFDVIWIDGPTSVQLNDILVKFVNASLDNNEIIGLDPDNINNSTIIFELEHIIYRREWSNQARTSTIAAVSSLSTDERHLLLIRFELADFYQGTDRVEEIARAIFAHMPARGYQGCHSSGIEQADRPTRR